MLGLYFSIDTTDGMFGIAAWKETQNLQTSENLLLNVELPKTFDCLVSLEKIFKIIPDS